MIKSKKLKSIVLGAVLGIGITVLQSHNTLAATYKVQSGDSLYKIATLFNTSTTTLINDNKLSSTNINIGQVLYVSSSTYTVKSGDSLYLISKRYGITLLNLRKANNLWNDYIYCGQVLNVPGIAKPVMSTSYSNSDVDLLARLINAEAEGEPYNAKVAVGAVVLNRVKSSLFPNSISSVIYQTINGYYQFTPVLNGEINKPATSESVQAAYAALNGQDPTNGAMFFYDNTVTNKWLLAKPVSITINKLIFAY